MKKVLPLLLLLLVASAGFSQEAAGQDFVPFVSKLKAKADESRILVTWRNPRNLQGTILLYRHSSEIDQDNLNDAVLIARLPADQQSYEDTPPEAGPYYYAVLIQEASGTVRELFVPFRNKTSRGVRVSVPPPAENAAARITGIQAEVVDDSVQVHFETSNPDRDLLLFRSDSPMAGTEDLLDAFAPLQLEAGTTRFVDYPIPGVESYYAVVDTELFKLGKQELVTGENTTDRGVVVPLGVSRVALLPVTGMGPNAGVEAASEAEAAGQSPAEKPIARTVAPAPLSPVRPGGQPAGQRSVERALAATPLPYLQPIGDSGNIYSIPQRRAELAPETRAVISGILASTPPVKATQRTVVILPEDEDRPSTGDSTGLHDILQEHLLTGDYAGAESKLQGFLNIRRSPYTEARVRFYLAQVYYFQGLYEEALLEFVLSQGQLYGPVQPWLESCFRHLWEQP